MATYTTCTTCATQLVVEQHGQSTHPSCADPLGQLTERWLSAVKADHHARADQLAAALEHADRAPRRPLVDSALTYAAWGWPVFPLVPGGKTPATRHGFHDATTDHDTIRGWWRAQPEANIGLPTGRRFDVLDVDMPTGTWPWVQVRDSECLGDIHGMVLTPRGLHVYLEPTGGGNAAGLGGMAGLDYRGVGGYVVAPPSRRDDGARYAWSVRPSPALTGVGEKVAVTSAA